MRDRIAWLSVLLLMLTFGCGHRPQQKPTNPPPAPETAFPLPEWAPKNPSPEFLRAARVLKPWPIEELLTSAQGDLAREARLKKMRRIWPAAYEFFGTLTDEQTQHFLSTGTVRIPVKSLSTQQRTALDNWLEAYRKNMAGLGPEKDDFLVRLYRDGAKEDLSNVEVGFSTLTGGGHLVKIRFWIGGGPDSGGTGITFATI
jgi:hypothetical protein